LKSVTGLLLELRSEQYYSQSLANFLGCAGVDMDRDDFTEAETLIVAEQKMLWFFYGFAAGVFAPLLWIVLTT